MRTEWKGNAGYVTEANALSDWMDDKFSTEVGAFSTERGHWKSPLTTDPKRDKSAGATENIRMTVDMWQHTGESIDFSAV